MYSGSFNELIECLPQYLESQGIDISKKFSCINPEHEDSSPSAHIYKGRVVKCFGCGSIHTIFDAAHELEGLPPKGSPDFFKRNVSELARRFGIALPKWSDSPILDIYQSIIEYCLDVYMPRRAKEEGLSLKDFVEQKVLPSKELNVLQSQQPVVILSPGWVELQQHLLEQGYEESDMRTAGIMQYFFPDKECLVYPLWLTHSVAVGFSIKNPDFVKGGNQGKYLNTPNNSSFNKGEYLYGMFTNPPISEPLYLVEGQKDTLASIIRNHHTIAPLGSHFTKEHVQGIVNRGYKKVVLVPDGDQGGFKGAMKTIQLFLSYGIACDFIQMPESKDPFDYLITDQNETYPEKVSGLKVYVDYLNSFGDVNTTSAKILDLLSEITQAIQREILCKEAAQYLNVTENAVIEDVEKLIQKKNDNKNSLVVSVLEKALEQGKHNPEEAIALMGQAYDYAQNIANVSKSFNNNFTMDLLDEIVTGKENRSGQDIHFRSEGLKPLSDILHKDGIGWTQEQLMAVGGDPHTGKSFCKDTKVLMFDGSIKLIQDVIVGDLLMGPDSKPREVKALGRGRERCVKVHPNYGESWACNESHILPLVCNRDKTPGFKKGKVYNIEVKDYEKLTDTQKHGLKLYRVPVDFPLRSVRYDPYYIGLWLGGGTRGEAHITTMDQVIIDYVDSFAKTNGYTTSINDDCKSQASRISVVSKRGSPNKLRRYLQGLLVNNQKRIPQEYLVNSKENRNKLLAGLIDSDGYKDNYGYEISTKCEGLREDILYLARSLGHRTTWTVKKVNNKKYYCIRITGYLHEVPVLLERKKIKQEEKRDKHPHPLRTGFQLEDIGEQDYYGVVLEDDHLFLLWDFTVTHNTALLLQIMVESLLYHPNVMCLHFSTDDPSSTHLARIISALVFNNDFYIADSLNNNLTGGKNIARKSALKRIKNWIASDRLVLKDQNFSSQFNKFGDLVKFYRDKYPDRRIITFNDNFHRNDDYRDKDNLRKQELLANDAKALCVKEKMALFCTVEYRKNKEGGKGTGPKTSDIKGDGSLSYHANLILNLYNEMIDNNGDIRDVENVHLHKGEALPKVIVNVSKNKISGNLGPLPMNLYGKNSYFKPSNTPAEDLD